MILLPLPKKVEEQEGTFAIRLTTMIMMDNTCAANARVYARMLQEEIETYAGLKVQIARGKARKGDIILKIDASLLEDEYTLVIEKENVTVTGGSLTSMGWGVQTLRQIVRQQAGILKAVQIQDRPSVSNRGFYHDVTRGRIQDLEHLKKLVDTLAFYKINQLQLYIEHTYLYRDFTEMWRDETPLTADEILELDAYCAERGIELVPSIATFGHLYKLLTCKTYAPLCELENSDDPTRAFSFLDRMNHHTLNVSDPKALQLICGMIEEFMSLCRSDKFNICADETFDLGKGKNAALAEEKGTGTLYVEFILKLFDFLSARGKTGMFWGDIISKYPELIHRLPEGSICLTWGYMPEQRDYEVRVVSEAGAVQYVCPGCCGWNTWINTVNNSYRNIKRMCEFGKKYGAVGVLNTDWGDYGHVNQPVFSVPGLIYGATFSWGDCDLSFEEINRQISILEFGDASGRLVQFWADTDCKSTFDWHHAVHYKEWTQQNMPTKMIMDKFLECKMFKVPQRNARILQLEQELREISRTMDTSRRGIVQNTEISLEMMRIWNEVGLYLWVKLTNPQEQFEIKDGCELAQDLERILYYYKNSWRESCKEGDLPRISDVFFWYADLLRESEKKQ